MPDNLAYIKKGGKKKRGQLARNLKASYHLKGGKCVTQGSFLAFIFYIAHAI